MENIFHFFSDFFKYSSLHGLRHLSRIDRLHPIEIFFWCLTIVSFISYSCINASFIWKRYWYNPTMVTIDRDYLNRNITFPPITFCFNEKFNETAAEEFLTERGFNESQSTNPRLKSFLYLLANFSFSKLVELISVNDNFFHEDEYIEIIERINNKFSTSASLSSTLEIFQFETIFTFELGLCYTFNSNVAPFISPKFFTTGIANGKMLEEVNYFDGNAVAMTEGLTANVDIYYHGPNELPSLLRKYTNEDPDQQSFISITLFPVVTRADERTRSLQVSQRRCKFEDESSSTYFSNIYTRDLCIYECKMNMIQNACGCLPFFYRKKGMKGEFCGVEGYMCIIEHLDSIDEMISNGSCNFCLKDCNDIRFLLYMSDTVFWFQESKVAWTLQQTKTIYKRELMFGFVEALQLTGANLSLFVGMSCLTLFEILFFIYLQLKKKYQN